MQRNTTRRLTAYLAVVAIIFVMLFSIMYVPSHLDHECTGEACHICSVIMLCNQNLKNVGTITAVVITALLLSLSIEQGILYLSLVFSNCSLISQKVRINI